MQEATTAAQQAVSRAVTEEGSGAITPTMDDPESPAIEDLASDDDGGLTEEHPTVMQDAEIPPNTLGEEVQLEDIPAEQEGGEELDGTLNDSEQPPPEEMTQEKQAHWIEEEPDLLPRPVGLSQPSLPQSLPCQYKKTLTTL